MYNQVVNTSPLSGDSQVLTRPGSKWGWDIDLSEVVPSELSEIEGYLIRFNGRQHLMTIHDFFRPAPRGTCNLSGVTTDGAVAQFVSTIGLKGCGAAKTLLYGDWVKIGSQLVMSVGDFTADGTGRMTIEFRHSLRQAIADNSACILDKPTSTYTLSESNLEVVRQDSYAQPGPKFRLVEEFS
jgi:hypothetical protein